MVSVKILISKKNSEAKRICNDTDEVYDCVMALSDNNHDTAANVQGWSDLATVGDVYDGNTFQAECIG